jgi:uncharacterized Rmd1/YagE family protein
VPARTHRFDAIAFEENLELKDLQRAIPGSRLVNPRELVWGCADGAGEVFAYPFGALVFHDVPAQVREAELRRVMTSRPKLTTKVVHEDFQSREEPGATTGIVDDVLVIDHLTRDRIGMVALTVAQSAAMEYYETIIEQAFRRIDTLVERMEKRGTVSMRTKPLLKLIGSAMANRNEVIAVLYLLDKPDVTWDDSAMDMIYEDLRNEFDLGERYESLEQKLRSVQEALELILDVARERRMMWLEIFVTLLFVFEIGLEIFRR